MAGPLKLSVIVPIFNEEKTVLAVLGQIQQQRICDVELEVIVVNDGSTDSTPRLIQSRPELYTKFVNLEVNQGKGGAVKAGLEAATGEYIIFQDADLEYDPAEYDRLLVPVLKFKADLVMGSRLIAPQYTRVHYFWNKQGNRLITTIFNVLYNKTFTDIYSCYLMYRRELVDPHKLKTLGFEQQAEILCKCMKAGNAFYEVPISYHGRTVAEGKKIRAHHIFSVIWEIIRQRFNWV